MNPQSAAGIQRGESLSWHRGSACDRRASHLSGITDADAPCAPRGCPFQARSLGEYLRLDRAVLSDSVDLCAERTMVCA